MRIHAHASWACLSIALLLGACASAPGGAGAAADGEVSHAAEPIISGAPSPTAQDSAVLVVAETSSGEARCTGVLIAPNVVLTARHCVAIPNEGGFGCNADGTLATGSTGGTLGPDIPPSNIYVFVGTSLPNLTSPDGGIHPSGQGQTVFPGHNYGTVVCSNDIAAVVLERSIPNTPIASVRLDGTVKPGDTVTSVGFGLDQTGVQPAQRMQRKDVSVLRVGPQEGSAVLPPVSMNTFEVGESICQGDSGGPAFDTVTGAVVGIVSSGGNSRSGSTSNAAAGCMGSDTLNYYSSTASFKDLILAALTAAGQKPLLEKPASTTLAPTGASCTQASDCQGNLCVAGGGDGGLVCSQSCDANTTCPSGFSCSTQSAGGRCNPAALSASASSSGGCSTSGPAPAGATSAQALAAAAILAFGLAAAARGRRRQPVLARTPRRRR